MTRKSLNGKRKLDENLSGDDMDRDYRDQPERDTSSVSDLDDNIIFGEPENVYTLADLNALKGSGSELYPRAIYHGYSTSAPRTDVDLIKFLLGKPRVDLQVARDFAIGRRRQVDKARVKDKTYQVRQKKKQAVEQSTQQMSDAQKHPIWYRQLKDALFDNPIELPDGSEILNLNRLDNLFVNIAKRNEFNALSGENKVFCSQLLKKSCYYIDQTFPDSDIIGYENGKWNASGWFNACLAVAASDRSKGCWPVNKGLGHGRPRVGMGANTHVYVSCCMVCLSSESHPLTNEIGKDKKTEVSHLCHVKNCCNPSHLFVELKKTNNARNAHIRDCILFCECKPKCVPVSREGYMVPCYKHEDGSCLRFLRHRPKTFIAQRSRSIG